MNELKRDSNCIMKKLKFKSNKMILVIVVILLSTGVISYSYYNNQYEVLFSNLDKGDFQKIENALKNEKIDIKIDDNTKTIMVPKNKVDKLRVQFAPILSE